MSMMINEIIMRIKKMNMRINEMIMRINETQLFLAFGICQMQAKNMLTG